MATTRSSATRPGALLAAVVLVLAGLGLLGWAYAWPAWTDHRAATAQAAQAAELLERWGPVQAEPAAPGAAPLVRSGHAVERLRAGRSETMLLEAPDLAGHGWVLQRGATQELLDAGPAWFTETATPGSPGNMTVIGHRTGWGSPFYDFPDLVAGSLVRVSTAEAVFTYEVITAEPLVFDETDTHAWGPRLPGRDRAAATLTLITCLIPTDERRLVVYADLVAVAERA